MKTLLAALMLVVGYAGLCFAGGYITPQFTYQVGVSSITTTIVSISNVTTTQADNPPLANRVVTEIQNIGAGNLWCLPSSTNTITVTVGNGREIPAGASWIISFLDKIYNNNDIGSSQASPVDFYCITDNASPTKVAVTQLY